LRLNGEELVTVVDPKLRPAIRWERGNEGKAVPAYLLLVAGGDRGGESGWSRELPEGEPHGVKPVGRGGWKCNLDKPAANPCGRLVPGAWA